MEKRIERGILRKKTEHGFEEKEYQMHLIGKDHLSQIIRLQDIVVENLNLSDIFQSDSREFLKDELKKGGKVIGVFTEDDLIAYRFITMPKGESMNLGVDLGLPKKMLERVGHLETTIVHPDYRGNGLQRKTLYHALEIFNELDYNHICSTISPENYHSLKNIMSGGLVIKKLKEKYGGKLRFVLHRDLHQYPKTQYHQVLEIDDVETVKRDKILEKGFVGYQTFKMNEGFSIRYGI